MKDIQSIQQGLCKRLKRPVRVECIKTSSAGNDYFIVYADMNGTIAEYRFVKGALSFRRDREKIIQHLFDSLVSNI
jgi:hypothetical protein